jgi:ubiquinone/menaquinone biosynthesis C-methylase UbiE
MDYDDCARDYAETRSTIPWILNPLVRDTANLEPGGTVIEIGCGTGDYIIALAGASPQLAHKAFDLSRGMLDVARSRSSKVRFTQADADDRFPYGDCEAHMAFMVNVIHHLRRLKRMFEEAYRILRPKGLLIVVTDSETNIRVRSLTRFFPEVLKVEIERYPRLAELDRRAEAAGFLPEAREPAEGCYEIDEEFIRSAELKFSSAMRLISDEAHAAGLRRLREARKRGDRWFSCYTILRYRKP